jgi:hypothetical protein
MNIHNTNRYIKLSLCNRIVSSLSYVSDGLHEEYLIRNKTMLLNEIMLDAIKEISVGTNVARTNYTFMSFHKGVKTMMMTTTTTTMMIMMI